MQLPFFLAIMFSEKHKFYLKIILKNFKNMFNGIFIKNIIYSEKYFIKTDLRYFQFFCSILRNNLEYERIFENTMKSKFKKKEFKF